MKQGKKWGVSRLIHKAETFEIYYISAKAGGYSSEHKHDKSNLFYVINGALEITIWQESGSIDKTQLGPHEMSLVPPHVWHKMTALTNVECIEIYFVKLAEPDIERRTEGGIE